MSTHHHENPNVPKGALIAVGMLILLSICAALYGSLTNHNSSRFSAAPVQLERDIRFADTADGGVDVTDWHSNELLAKIEPQSDHFIRVVMRSLIRERRSHNVALDAPFRLALREDNHITLEDSTTGELMYLRAFGATNAAAFGRLLDGPEQKMVSK